MKKLLLAFAILFAIVMFQSTTPNGVVAAETPKTVITQTEDIPSEEIDMTGYGYTEGQKTAFRKITLAESVKIFEDKNNAILMYGKTDGEECRLAVPVLDEAAKEMGVTIYYVDMNDVVDPTDQNALATFIKDTYVKDSSGAMSFFVPDVIAVREGNITSFHVSLVDSFAMTNNPELTEDQRTELKNFYIKLIHSAEDPETTPADNVTAK